MTALCNVALSLAVLSYLFVSLYELTWNMEKNACQMTYMREYPEYLPIELPTNVSAQFPSYGLYIYGEGSYVHRLRSSTRKFRGIPVLFIPGNGGSHYQVRSLGSVSLVMSDQAMQHFNYFTIDFNEELFALYGGRLYKQAEFVAECVKQVLDLYKGATNPPKSVILVGHSMGGALARAVLTLPSFDKSTVRLIITQATPHQAAVVLVDSHIDAFYKAVNRFWMSHNNDTLKHITVISTGGGFRDVQVPYYLTTVDQLILPSNGLSVSTTAVPRAWVSTDHLCAVWCLQMVTATVSSLFELIDTKTKQLVENDLPAQVFRRHFQGLAPALTQISQFNYTPIFEAADSTSLAVKGYKAASSKYYVMEVHADTDRFYAAFSKKSKWIFGCRLEAKQEKCTEGDHLSHLSKPLPSADPDRNLHQFVLLDGSHLSSYTHLVLLVPSASPRTPVSLHAELFSSAVRTVVYHVPDLADLITDFPRSLFVHTDVVIAHTDTGALFYNVSLVGLSSMYQAYVARLSILQCSSQDHASEAPSVMKLHLPWSKGADVFATAVGSSESINISLKLQAPRLAASEKQEAWPELHLHLQPECTYSLHVDISFSQIFAQFSRHYLLLVPAYLMANLLMALSSQVLQPGRSKGFSGSFICTHSWAAGLVIIILPAYAVAAILYYVIGHSDPDLLGGEDDVYLKTDLNDVHDRGLSFLLLPLCLHSIAHVAVLLQVSVITVALSILARLLPTVISTRLLSRVGYIAYYGLLLMAAYVSIWHCAALGFAVTHLLTIGQGLIISSRRCAVASRESAEALQRTPLVVILLAIEQYMLALTYPSLHHWWSNYRFVSSLADDPWTWHALSHVSCLALGSLTCNSLQMSHHQSHLLKRSQAGIAIVLALAAVLYGCLHLYRLVGVAVTALALPIIFGPVNTRIITATTAVRNLFKVKMN